MRDHLARSACEAAGPRRKPRLGGEAAHRKPPIDRLYSVSVTFCHFGHGIHRQKVAVFESQHFAGVTIAAVLRARTGGCAPTAIFPFSQAAWPSTSRISTRRKRLLNKSRVQSAGQICFTSPQAKGKQQQVESDGVDTTEKEKQPRTELLDCVTELLESKLNEGRLQPILT
jgi:hypothetical protein